MLSRTARESTRGRGAPAAIVTRHPPRSSGACVGAARPDLQGLRPDRLVEFGCSDGEWRRARIAGPPRARLRFRHPAIPAARPSHRGSTPARALERAGLGSDAGSDEADPLAREHSLLAALYAAAVHPAESTVRCTHIEIPQVAETSRVMGHSPWWVWGFEHGVNEHAVAIGNQTVFSNEPIEERPGLIGMHLVELGLERGRSA
jgi:hypothetical protein